MAQKELDTQTRELLERIADSLIEKYKAGGLTLGELLSIALDIGLMRYTDQTGKLTFLKRDKPK